MSTPKVLEITPRPAEPLYPDVPWWAVLVASLVFAIVGVAVGAYFGIAGLSSTAGSVSVGSLVTDTLAYIPHILLLFGVLADMFTLQGVWSIPSLVGLLSIFVNYVFEYFWKGLDELGRTAKNVATKTASAAGVPVQERPATAPAIGPAVTVMGGKKKGGALFQGYNGCTVQGLEGFNTPYAPQTLVVTATVFSYYCYDLVRNRGWINSIGAIVAFIGAYIAQTAIIGLNSNGGCRVGGQDYSITGQSIRALFEGLLFGGVSYSIVQTYAPARLPSSMISPFPAVSASDLSPGPDGRMYDKDGYPYIILPNGMAVPDMSDPKSRAAFGALAADATGTELSLGSNCPATAGGCPAPAPLAATPQ